MSCLSCVINLSLAVQKCTTARPACGSRVQQAIEAFKKKEIPFVIQCPSSLDRVTDIVTTIVVIVIVVAVHLIAWRAMRGADA